MNDLHVFFIAVNQLERKNYLRLDSRLDLTYYIYY